MTTENVLRVNLFDAKQKFLKLRLQFDGVTMRRLNNGRNRRVPGSSCPHSNNVVESFL